MSGQGVRVARIPRCVLHIGAEKTGTTAVQTALVRERDGLLRHGILYPDALRSPRKVSHTNLPMHAADPHRVDDLRQGAGLTTPARVEAHRDRTRQALVEEVQRVQAGPAGPLRVLLLSSEHCQSRLRTVAEIEVLRDLIQQVCNDVTVILYLRPQHEVALSLYSTRMKAGMPHAEILSEDSAQPGYYDYGSLVDRWATVFGEGKLQVSTFERHRLVAGSIVEDFRQLAGLPIALELPPTRRNPSLSPRGIRLLGGLNSVLPRYVLGRRNPLGRPINRVVETFFPGTGPDVEAGDAMAFFDRFSESNERVRAAHFPERETLFSPDFSRYGRSG